MKNIDIPAHEQGTTRLFSMSMEASDARQVKADVTRQAVLLGIDSVDAAGVEVFQIVDLGDLGLAGYLRDGIDAQEADLARDRVKLAALDGWFMLVHSRAFEGKAMTLQPDPKLTLIGTYRQQGADTAAIEIVSEAAQPYSGTPRNPPVSAPDTRRAGSLVVAALIGVATLLLWWVLA